MTKERGESENSVLGELRDDGKRGRGKGTKGTRK